MFKYLRPIPVVVIFMLVLAAFGEINAQISAPGAIYTESTSYPVAPTSDPIYLFCAAPDAAAGVLRAESGALVDHQFRWERFNPQSGVFDEYFVQTALISEIRNLADGGYRVTITGSEVNAVYTAWVLNSWFTLSASVGNVTCFYFDLSGSITDQAPLVYYDLVTAAPIVLSSGITFEWREGDVILNRNPSFRINDPPTKNTDYTFHASTRFGCQASVKVTYQSVVTKAAFTASPMSGEAPLTVNFSNNSENGDRFQWFFFRDLDQLKQSAAPVDSFLTSNPYEDFSPEFTFENSGTYMVKLVSVKTSDLNCKDTLYLDSYIVADTSFVQAPNVFTPNGDGTNDHFVVKFWSVKEVKISIFNRWGQLVHRYEDKDVRGFENTWLVSAWDGNMGGREASPGVYYYVVEAIGRDNRERWAKGFVHLFRDGRQ